MLISLTTFGIGGQEVRVAAGVRQEDGLHGSHDPPEDPPVRGDGVDREAVVALGAELERRAVPDVDRRVAIAERLLQEAHHAVEGLRGRAFAGEQAADGFDRGELASAPSGAEVRAPQPRARPLQAGHDAAAADRDDHRGHRDRADLLAGKRLERRECRAAQGSGPCPQMATSVGPRPPVAAARATTGTASALSGHVPVTSPQRFALPMKARAMASRAVGSHEGEVRNVASHSCDPTKTIGLSRPIDVAPFPAASMIRTGMAIAMASRR